MDAAATEKKISRLVQTRNFSISIGKLYLIHLGTLKQLPKVQMK